MRISELITRLEQIKAEEGDLDIVSGLAQPTWDGKRVIDVQTLDGHTFNIEPILNRVVDLKTERGSYLRPVPR